MAIYRAAQWILVNEASLPRASVFSDKQASSIELGKPLSSMKLAIARKFFRDANLFWINKESCSTAIITWPLMDRRHTNQLLNFGTDVISTTVAMLTGYCVMGRHAERMMLPFDDFCSECRAVKKEEIVAHFLCQCSSLARCADIGYLAHHFLFIKVSGCFLES